MLCKKATPIHWSQKNCNHFDYTLQQKNSIHHDRSWLRHVSFRVIHAGCMHNFALAGFAHDLHLFMICYSSGTIWFVLYQCLVASLIGLPLANLAFFHPPGLTWYRISPWAALAASQIPAPPSGGSFPSSYKQHNLSAASSRGLKPLAWMWPRRFSQN